jgi:peroxisomal 2,4-dienoyl-CoA reductase
VTGGGSGIGLEVARQLARHGCRLVVVGGRRQSFLDSAVRALREEIRQRRREAGLCGSAAAGGRGGISRQQQQRAFGFACDVRQPEQCRRLLEFFAERCRDDDEEDDEEDDGGGCPPSSLPGLDVLVNGAAGNFLAAAEHLSPRGFETVLAIDALGTFNVTSAAFPYLRRSSESAASLEGSRAGDGAVVRFPPSCFCSCCYLAGGSSDCCARRALLVDPLLNHPFLSFCYRPVLLPLTVRLPG